MKTIAMFQHKNSHRNENISRKYFNKQLVFVQKIRGKSERQSLIIKWLSEEPGLLLSVKEIENRFNVSNPTARIELMELENKGYLKVFDLNKKTKAFGRSPMFDDLPKMEPQTIWEA